MAEDRTNQQLSNITAELAEQTVQDRKHHSQQLLVLKSIAMTLGQGLQLEQMRFQFLSADARHHPIERGRLRFGRFGHFHPSPFSL